MALCRGMCKKGRIHPGCVSGGVQVPNPRRSRIGAGDVVQAHSCFLFLPSLKAVKALSDEMSQASHNNLEHAV